MIEAIVRNYLITILDIPVYIGEKPINKPKEYVVAEILDSGRINHIDAITFSFTSYSDSLMNASILNNRVKDAMFDIISIDNISSSKLGGGSQNIDTQTKEYSYECIFNLIYTEE